MRKSDLKPGAEYAVRINSIHGTLYRATYVGERVVQVTRSRLGYPRAVVDEDCLVFTIVAAITRPHLGEPDKPGEELLVTSTRYVEAAWDDHVEVERVQLERLDAMQRQEQVNRHAIITALEALGLSVATTHEYPAVCDVQPGAIRGTAGRRLGYCTVELNGEQVVRIARKLGLLDGVNLEAEA